MFGHVVCFKWNRELDAVDIKRIDDALTELASVVPGLVEYRFGPDLGHGGEKNWDYAIVAKFNSESDWRVYDSHPVHDKVRAEVFKSIIAERSAVQFSG